MLCTTVAGYTQPCGIVSGGVSRMWVFDPSDFDFTQATADSKYSAIARVAGATAVGGALMYPILFTEEEAEYKFTKTTGAVSVKYEHSLEAQLPKLSQELTVFMKKMDVAGTCCGLGLVMEMNNGQVFVMGEKVVNSAAIPRFKVKMSDATGGSGKKWEDFNGANVIFKGNYNRALVEYDDVADIVGMES